MKKRRKVRRDAYVNTLTGLGDWTQDKILGGRNGALAVTVPLLGVRDAEDRWRGSDLGARIVETIPNEMLREWFKLTIQPEEPEPIEGESEPQGEPNEIENASAQVKAETEGEGQPPEAEAQPFGQNGQEEEKKQDAYNLAPPAEATPEAAVPKEPPGGFPPKEGQPLPQVPNPSDIIAKQSEAALETAETVEAIEKKMDELAARQAFHTALCYERAYGGGAIFMGVDDGQDPIEPLNPDTVKDVTFLNVFMGGRDGECVAKSYYADMKAANYGKPEYYEIRNIGLANSYAQSPVQQRQRKAYETTFVVHESRLLVFDGAPVSQRARSENQGWGDSIFTRVDEILSQYNQTWNGISNLMSDFAQAWLKIPGLAAKMSSRNKTSDGNPITNRARVIQQTRSIARMLFLDGEEEFKREVASVSGVDGMLQQFALRLAAAADMPVTLLMGQSPAGMNATGESDIRFFYDRTAAKQKMRVEPQLLRLLRVIMAAKMGPTGGQEPEKWSACFNPLYQMSDIEKAQYRKTVADTDKVYIDAGVLTPEEVAASAFGSSEFNIDRTLDLEGRAKAQPMTPQMGMPPGQELPPGEEPPGEKPFPPKGPPAPLSGESGVQKEEA